MMTTPLIFSSMIINHPVWFARAVWSTSITVDLKTFSGCEITALMSTERYALRATAISFELTRLACLQTQPVVRCNAHTNTITQYFISKCAQTLVFVVGPTRV